MPFLCSIGAHKWRLYIRMVSTTRAVQIKACERCGREDVLLPSEPVETMEDAAAIARETR
jgi:hypothetical protein